MIKAYSIGTTTRVLVIEKKKGLLCDFTIQNLSANKVYVLSNKKQSTSDGIEIVAAGSYSDDKSDEELHLLADGASSDVRIRWNYYDPKLR